ncbi:hypothetical protein [Campylobacter suis]|uniref:Uncharacterized protein n=1 Tax=Campylobacter suis TaxID=2790657 RepID=A0ABM8Q1N1_9BACT|nr:hypothetical protein [Campylobacter suis]CAD7286733.1 hypothetical protein LMG8286_00510 [Campylobacter suis]
MSMYENLVFKALLASSLVAVSAIADGVFIGVHGDYNFMMTLIKQKTAVLTLV